MLKMKARLISNLKPRLRSSSTVRSGISLWRLTRPRAFPTTAEELRASDIYTQPWYYSVELLPGVVTKGMYPETFPLLPRLVLRNCEIRGLECLDLGSMEGLVPVLMTRGGARRVVATDYGVNTVDKIAAVQHYYGAKFQYRSVGLMYRLDKKIRRQSFDLINCSGLLYHVISPFMVLAGVRPLLKRGGLMIVSTNVAHIADYAMEFNQAGRWQDEPNTFWYPSVPLLDYLLRYLKLAPIDCVYLPHTNIRSDIRYVGDKPSGDIAVVCRAVDDLLPTSGDGWMKESGRYSWEHADLVDWRRAESNDRSEIVYRGNQERSHFRKDTASLDLWRAVSEGTPLTDAARRSDTNTLLLDDQN